MPSPKYYQRQAETLLMYAGVCDDPDVADRLLSMAHEMMQKAQGDDDGTASLQPHMLGATGESDGKNGRS
jgi:hypothetical protein